ncbi:NAD(P)H-dependent oxidoreductase [Erysipelothrix urinaevulpis]|uniref:NAD(P)H-dependent oxidoreductase n=1 Tax=Erysipelothrix urinaevulpis TaxID=2683717 RepID=UPI001357EE4F|nr:NAD(P)H-dependent oxidoreductase [Erysipelothrix urinaevulpis]
MKSLIVYAHPWDGSFNQHVLLETKKILESRGDNIDIIDLYKDGFNPVLDQADLKVFGQGNYADPIAEDYANRLKQADNVIFVFPIWWYGPPAILKGFFDKVFLKNHTYKQNDKGEMTGILTGKKAIALTTANIDQYTLMNYLGNPIENTYLNGIMKLCGIPETKWVHCPTVHLEESRTQFLKEIKESV